MRIKKKLEWMLTKEDFIKRAREIHENKYDLSKVKYVNNHTKVCIICPEHGEFWQTVSMHLQGNGCPKCKQSHLEKEIEIFLEKNNIKYVYQKRFDWLGLQSLDFYLPDYNIAIECQGEQHFNEVLFFKNVTLEKRIKLDERKYDLCKEHNINILYYTNVTINEEFLNKHKYYFTNKELLQEIKRNA